MHSDGHECHSNGSSLRIDISPITKPTYKQQSANQLLLQVACMTACTNLAYQPKDQSDWKVNPDRICLEKEYRVVPLPSGRKSLTFQVITARKSEERRFHLVQDLVGSIRQSAYR